MSALHCWLEAMGLEPKRLIENVPATEAQIDGLGKPRLGKRYIFFARRDNQGSDLGLIKSYELREGHVFTNDSRPSRSISTFSGVPEAWKYEALFLEAVREEVQRNVNQSNSKQTVEKRQQ